MKQATFCLTNVDHCCWLMPLFFDILVLGFRLRSPPLLYASVCYCDLLCVWGKQQCQADYVRPRGGSDSRGIVRSVVRAHELRKDHPWPVCAAHMNRAWSAHDVQTTDFSLFFSRLAIQTPKLVNTYFQSQVYPHVNLMLDFSWSSWGTTTHIRKNHVLNWERNKRPVVLYLTLLALVVKAKHIISLSGSGVGQRSVVLVDWLGRFWCRSLLLRTSKSCLLVACISWLVATLHLCWHCEE